MISNDTKGFVRANLKEGAIFARNTIKTAPRIKELEASQDDAKLIMKSLGSSHMEAISCHKYGIVREELIRRGSLVVKRGSKVLVCTIKSVIIW